MAAGKHSKGKHSVPKGGRREIEIPRGPGDPGAGRAEVPEEIAKTAAGKMQTVGPAHDEVPDGEAATGETLESWVEGQAPGSEAGGRGLSRKAKVAVAVVVLAAVLVVAGLAFFQLYRPTTTPSQVTATALRDIGDGDFAGFGELYAGDAPSVESSLSDALARGADLGSESKLESRLNDEQRAVLSELREKAADFDFTLGSETVDGDAASVQVTVTTYDFGAFAQEVLGDYIAEGLEASSKGDLESEADSATRLVRVIREKAADLGAKEKRTDTVFSLQRDGDGSWKLSGLTQENLDALSGGLVSTADSMSAQLEAGRAD